MHMGLENSMDMKELFSKNSTTRKIKDGYLCRCKQKQWAVFAPTKEEAESEGWHYFLQYFSDGLYQ